METVNPVCAKGVPFSNTKLRIPHGFLNLVEGLAKEILRDKPTAMLEYSAIYFDKLLKIREETGFDPAVHGAKLIDKLANAGRSCRLTTTCEKMAAIKIQAKYRQFKARQYLLEMRRQKAALRIQSMFRGYQTRKDGIGAKIKELSRMDAGRARALGRDECADYMGTDFPAAPAGPDMGDCYGGAFDKDKDVADCMAKYADPSGDWMEEERQMAGFDPCKGYGPDGQPLRGSTKRARRARMMQEKQGEMALPDCPDTYGIPHELLSQADKDCQAKVAHYRKICRDDYDEDYYDDMDDSDSDESDSEAEGGGGVYCKDKTNWSKIEGSLPKYMQGPCVEYGPCKDHTKSPSKFGADTADAPPSKKEATSKMVSRDKPSAPPEDFIQGDKQSVHSLDLNSQEVKEAATRIHASMKGFIVRNSLTAARSSLSGQDASNASSPHSHTPDLQTVDEGEEQMGGGESVHSTGSARHDGEEVDGDGVDGQGGNGEVADGEGADGEPQLTAPKNSRSTAGENDPDLEENSKELSEHSMKEQLAKALSDHSEATNKEEEGGETN